MAEGITISKLSGFGRGKDVTLDKTQIVLGTDPGADVRFDPTWDKTVSPRHLTLEKRGNDWWMIDQSRDGTWIDGRRIKQEKLVPGATVELGKGGPRVRIGEASAAAPSPGRVDRPAFSTNPATTPSPRTSREEVSTDRPVRPPIRSTPTEPAGDRRPSAKLPTWLAVAAVLLLAALGAVWLLSPSKNKENSFAARGTEPQRYGNVKVLAQPDANAQTDWQPVVDMDDQIFPALLIAAATMKDSPFDKLNDSPNRLGDKRAAVGVEISNPTPHSKVRVEIGENEVMRSTVYEAELPAAETYRIYPTPAYRFDVLGRIKQSTPVAITISVSLNGVSLGQKAKTARVASINDCPFAVVTGEDEKSAIRLDWMFAAYVNENHPISDELRKDALKTGIVPAFIGYQSNTDEVYKQVFAIWYVLQRRGVRYSNITTTPGSSKKIYSQYVRFIDQSINNSQANCVDGSVLFASILRQIGIDPILVLVPGHMFMGFYVDANGKQADFLETTMIGNLPKKSDTPKESSGFAKDITAIQGMLEPATDTGTADKDSLECFVAAVKAARSEYNEYFGGGNSAQRSYLYQSSTVRKEKANCQALPVATAREMGVMPIGYQP